MPQMAGPWAIGRNLSLFASTPQTSNASGVLTPGTLASFLGRSKSCTFAWENTLVDIHSADAAMANYVITVGDFTITITELVSASGQSVSAAQFFANQYVCVTFQLQAFGGSPGPTITAYGVLSSETQEYTEGEQTAVLVVRPVGIVPTQA